MEYVGIQTQQSRNNIHSLLLLVFFPLIVLALTFAFCALFVFFDGASSAELWGRAFGFFCDAAPWVFGAVMLWFAVAYFANVGILARAVRSKPLERGENKRVYNLLENLCMSQGMPMPGLMVIEDGSLNAFASGVDSRSYTVTLTRGIMEKLDDAELEGVIAHELSHIRNRDVRLMIVSIVFVGIFEMVALMALRAAPRVRGKNSGGAVVMLLIVAALAGIGALCSTLLHFGISRKREYLADAGAAEMTRNPLGLASALRKISGNPRVAAAEGNSRIARLFIESPAASGKSAGLFDSHPPVERRIEILEQF